MTHVLPRPLDSLRSFKLKVSLVVGIALLVASATFWIGASWQFRYALLAALVVSLAATQFIAHGMTSPLREMTAAAKAMARGDYSMRVRASSRDEVGQLAEAFNTMSGDLEAAEKYRRELIGNVAHEIKTPIAALRAVLENMVDGVTAADPASLSVALHQTERLGDLVGELLDLSRVEGGVLPLRPTEFDTRALLEDAASAHEGRVSITVALDTATVVADRSRLAQVITNLVDNAVRHATPHGVVQIRAHLARDRTVVVFDVIDDGAGIEPTEHESVFDRFTKGGSTDGGTGLGLSIARWATELHGGTIAVRPAESGCHISVSIPRL